MFWKLHEGGHGKVKGVREYDGKLSFAVKFENVGPVSKGVLEVA